jgi:hypothetical protein
MESDCPWHEGDDKTIKSLWVPPKRLPNHPEEMGPKFSKLLSKFQSRVAYHPWFLGLILHLEVVYSFWNCSF